MSRGSRVGISRRLFLASVSAVAITTSARARFPHGSVGATAGFHPLLVGAGGFILTMDISPDGTTRLISKDAGGANIWNAGADKWDQLITTVRMPATDVGVGLYVGGCYANISAPGTPTTIYLAYGAATVDNSAFQWVFKSTDRGQIFNRTTFSSQSMSTGQSYKFHSPKCAADPQNANVVYLGVPPVSFTATSITNASPTVISYNSGSGSSCPAIGEAIQFTTTGTLPTGLSTATTYYVSSSGYTANPGSFKVAATRGAALAGTGSIATSSAGSGTHSFITASAYQTADGGTTWDVVPNIPITGNTQPAYGICFDPSSTVSGGKTQGIFIFAASTLYHSTNAGTSFTAVPSSPAVPSGVDNGHGKMSTDGYYYLLFGNHNPSTDKVWRLHSDHTTWLDLSATIRSQGHATDPFKSIATSPLVAGNVFVIVDPGYSYISTDHGTTWTQGGVVASTRTGAGDVPWLGNTNQNPMDPGDICLDPLVPDKYWLSDGISPWYSTATVNNIDHYQSVGRGIEELICNQIVAPPNGYPITVNWDRPFFVITDPNSYPSNHGPNYTNVVQFGSSIDWATSDPAFIVGLTDNSAQSDQEQSSYSTDKGITLPWTKFTSNTGGSASGHVGGNIAASTTTNWVWAQANHGDVYNTTDKGVTWNLIVPSKFTTNGVTATGLQASGSGIKPGFCPAISTHGFYVAADRETTGRFLLHNWQTVALGGGTYLSTNGGADWLRKSTQLSTDNVPSGFNVTMTYVPRLSGANASSLQGCAMFTAGHQQYPFLMFTKNDGGVWSKAGTGVQQVGDNWCFGFGAIAPGNDFPAVCVVGFLNGVYGIWVSNNSYADWTATPNGSNELAAITWTNIGTFPLNNTDEIVSVDGDKSIVGKWYFGFRNSGYAYRLA